MGVFHDPTAAVIGFVGMQLPQSAMRAESCPSQWCWSGAVRLRSDSASVLRHRVKRREKLASIAIQGNSSRVGERLSRYSWHTVTASTA